MDWDKDFLLRCAFWAEVVVVSGRCIAFNCDRALCADMVEQIKLSPKKNAKVLSILVWFDSENTGGGEVVESPNFCLFPVVGIAPNCSGGTAYHLPGQFIARFCIKFEQLQKLKMGEKIG